MATLRNRDWHWQGHLHSPAGAGARWAGIKLARCFPDIVARSGRGGHWDITADKQIRDSNSAGDQRAQLRDCQRTWSCREEKAHVIAADPMMEGLTGVLADTEAETSMQAGPMPDAPRRVANA